MALWDISKLLVELMGAEGGGAHQSTRDARDHFGDTEMKGRDKTLSRVCIRQLQLSHS